MDKNMEVVKEFLNYWYEKIEDELTAIAHQLEMDSLKEQHRFLEGKEFTLKKHRDKLDDLLNVIDEF